MNYTKIAPSIHLITDDLERKKFEIEIVYSTGGSWFESRVNRGKKHLMEHCIVSRTKTQNFKQFQEFQFAENLFFNAFTSTTSMGVSGSSHFKDAQLLTKTLLEQAVTPTFDEEILKQEKEIVLREISERSGEPSYRLHYDLMAKIFIKSSYDNHQVLGDSKMVSKTSFQDLDFLHTQNLESSQLIISLVGGDRDKAEIGNQIKEFFLSGKGEKFDKINDQSLKNLINYSVPSVFKEFSYLPVYHKLAHSHVDMHIYIPVVVDFETKATRKIFEELFLNYYGVLYDKLRNEKGLVYSLYSSFQFSTQSLYLNLSCEQNHVKEILQIVEEVFSDFKKYFSKNKLETLLKVVKKKIEMSKDTPWSLASSLYDNLINYGEVEDLDGLLKKLGKITEKDILQFYKTVGDGLKRKKVVVVSNNKGILSL